MVKIQFKKNQKRNKELEKQIIILSSDSEWASKGITCNLKTFGFNLEGNSFFVLSFLYKIVEDLIKWREYIFRA